MLKRINKYFWPLVLFIIALASLVAGVIAWRQGLWFDEGYSILVSQKSLADLIHFTSVDVHPPVYYLLLKFWASLFGYNELVLRLLSLLFAGLSIFVSAVLIKKLFNKRIALLSVIFIAFNPLILRYSFEIRMYSLMALIGILATYILIRALESKKTSKIIFYGLYAVLVALGVLTHYYMVFLWLAHLVWLVYITLKKQKPLFKQPWVLAYLASLLLFLPWLPIALKQVGGKTLASVVQAMTLENIIGIFSFNFVYQPVWQLGAVLSIVIILTLAMVAGLFIKAYGMAIKKYQFGYSLLLAYSFVPLIIMTIIGIFKPVYIERYIVPFMIGAMGLLAVSVALAIQKSGVKTRLLAYSLVIVMLVGVFNLFRVGNYNFQRLEMIKTKDLVQAIDCNANNAVLAADPYVYIQFYGYLNKCNFYVVSDKAEKVGGYAPIDRQARLKTDSQYLDKYSKVYYVDYKDIDLPELLKGFKVVDENKYQSIFLKELINN